MCSLNLCAAGNEARCNTPLPVSKPAQDQTELQQTKYWRKKLPFWNHEAMARFEKGLSWEWAEIIGLRAPRQGGIA